jgi:hypothetical protein
MNINISSILAQSKAIYDDICGQLIASDEIGQLVRVHYAPIWEPSSTPQFPEWGNASINGTPNLSPNGNSQKQTEVTEEIRMRVYSSDATGFGRSIFRRLAGTKYVEGQLLTIGLMTDYKKVANSVKADFYLGTEATTGIRSYKLATEIHPHGFGKDKFFFCFWEKA